MDASHATLVTTTLSALALLGNYLPDGGCSSRLEANRDRMGSALAYLASTSSALNVGEYQHFAKALTLALSRSTYLENSKSYKSPPLREDIFKFQFTALKKHYFKLVDAKSPQVFKALDGTERQFTFHNYIFDVLKAVHKKDVVGLDDLCRIMAGDAKTPGATSEKYDIGTVTIERSRAAAWMARAMANSGAGDLLRPYRFGNLTKSELQLVFGSSHFARQHFP